MFNHHDLRAFLLVAETESFTKAAAQLGVSRSAVSQSISQLERQLGTSLFHRSTRKVATTETGQLLFQQISPLFNEISLKISEVLSQKDRLQGTLRINGTPNSLWLAWDKFRQFQADYPDVALELISEIRFVDIIKEKFDAGIRSGDALNQDVIAVKISQEQRMCCVATADYFHRYGKPKTPDELSRHQCVRVRLPTHGGLLNWQFKSPQIGETITTSVQGKWIFNDTQMMIQSALDGLGLVWIERALAQKYLDNGELISVLDEWAMVYPPDYLYFPHRQVSPALRALVDFLRV